MQSKLNSNSQIQALTRRLRRRGKRIVFTNGCFDILHAGHVCYLNKARQLGDFLVVGLNSDKSVKQIKGRSRPINSQKARSQVLCALSSVDAVVIFNEDTPLKLIKVVRPHVLVKGGDWSLRTIAGYSEVKLWGGSVRQIKFVKGYSTTKLIKRLGKR